MATPRQDLADTRVQATGDPAISLVDDDGTKHRWWSNLGRPK
jgi:hypothetical protein